jgi:deoxyribodipyrimidine photolyase-related protein
MATLRLILGDQLTRSISALEGVASGDTVLLAEVHEEATYAPHHPKKIAFLFSAMRHFAQALRDEGIHVHYTTLDDAANTHSLEGEVTRVLAACGAGRVVATEAGEWRLHMAMRGWQAALGVPVDIRPDTRFLCHLDEFRRWAGSKKQLRMEFFYREMRRAHGLLLEADGSPCGGQWNFDAENRKPPAKGMRSPQRLSHRKDTLTQEVLALVKREFSHHFGELEPFHFAVTREQALAEATHFIDQLLPQFGDYQDAMVMGEAYLYHSLLSCYLNAGLLLPLELCQMAETAYRQARAPLNAVEGFIRQIAGWREYVRGIYWRHMPGYAGRNALDAQRPLPGFYWGSPTHMACVAEAVRHTRMHAYSHHIQRLMVTGNFALLAGIDPHEVHAWYLAVYADAYEWVEMPNTLGMALFADGGIMASKPYAASGKYIDRMSDFCRHCRYDPAKNVGEDACPFNALYWDFLSRNMPVLRGNQRLAYAYANWQKMDEAKRQALKQQASLVFERLDAGTL